MSCVCPRDKWSHFYCPLPLLGIWAHAKPPEVFEQLLLYISPYFHLFFFLSLPGKLVLLPTLNKGCAKSRADEYLLVPQ